MNKLKMFFLKFSVIASITFSPVLCFADESSRDFNALVKDASTLTISSSKLGYQLAMFAGFLCVFFGFLGVIFAGKTNDPSKTKTGACLVVIVGLFISGITGFMNMGNQSINGKTSEYQQFQTENGTTFE